MLPKIGTPVTIGAMGADTWGSPVLLQHFTVKRFTQPIVSNSNDDGYLFVLLADQEHIQGRTEQALTLLDAAYSAFDRIVADE